MKRYNMQLSQQEPERKDEWPYAVCVVMFIDILVCVSVQGNAQMCRQLRERENKMNFDTQSICVFVCVWG